MNKTFAVIVTICIILFNIGCVNNAELNNSVITDVQPIPTRSSYIPSPTPEPLFEDFDSSYMNLQSKNSQIVVKDEKVYFTSGRHLFYYDIMKDEKRIIDDNLVVSNIHIVDKYLYFLKEDAVNRLNLETSKIERIITASEACRFIRKDEGKKMLKDAYSLTNFYIIDDIIYFTCRYFGEDGEGGPSYSGITTKIDEWEYVDIEKIDYSNPTKENYYVEEIVEEFNNDLESVKIYCRFKYTGGRKALNNIYYSIEKVNSIFTLNYGSTLKLLLSDDKVYFSSWPDSDTTIRGYELGSDKIIFEQAIDGSVANLVALNQYVFGYYYDRMHLENYDAKEGVIVIDTKKDLIYMDSEINDILSGDIDYTNLYHTDYYLDGTNLYILENDLNEKKISGLPNREIEEMEKYGITFMDSFADSETNYWVDTLYIDLPSNVNIYKAEVIDGKLHFTQIYKEFEREN